MLVFFRPPSWLPPPRKQRSPAVAAIVGFLFVGVGLVHSRGAVNWCQRTAGSGGSQGFPARASRMASSAVMPWAAAESR